MRLKLNSTLLVTLLVVYFLTKMLWDKYIPNILELLSLTTIGYGFLMGLIRIRSKKILSFFATFGAISLYVLINGFFKDNTDQFNRAIYEYIFYLMIAFSLMYFLKKSDIKSIVEHLAPVAFVVIILSWYECLTRTYIIANIGASYTLTTLGYGFRATVFSRSYLCHGIVIGFFSIMFMYQYIESTNKKYLLFSLISYFSILTTSSRGPFVSCTVGLSVMFMLNYLIKNKSINKKMTFFLIAIILITIVYLFLQSGINTGNGAIDYFLKRVRSITNWTSEGGNLGRIKLWNRTVEWFKESPVFGIGPSKTGSWGEASRGVTESGLLKRLCELGIVGFIIYYSLIVRILLIGKRIYGKLKIDEKRQFIMYIGIILLVLVNDLTLQSTEEIQVFFILSIGLGGVMSFLWPNRARIYHV